MAKINMVKRSIGMLLAILVAFSLFGCQSLEEYKANAKTELNNYVRELSFLEGGKPAKNHINGPTFDKNVDDGKSSIDSASSRIAVDKELNNAKTAINAIPIVFRSDTSSPTLPLNGVALLSFPLASHYTFYLKHFDENTTFGCSADAGIITHNAVDKPYSSSYSDYEVFFGREPSVMNWNINFGVNSEQNGYLVLFRQDFIDIIIKIDDVIIGYMVVEMYFTTANYTPKLLAFAINSKIGNEYQPMDEEEVKTAIEIIKNEYKIKDAS